MNDCPHRLDLLKDVRISPDGDPISGNKLGALADCQGCGQTVLLNTQVIETTVWGEA